MINSTYDKYPSTKINDAWIKKGWENILPLFKNDKILSVDFYTGVLEDEVIDAFSKLSPDLLINTRSLFKSETEILKMTDSFMTNDSLFGYITNLRLKDFFDKDLVENARNRIKSSKGKVLVIGIGATYIIQAVEATTVYVNMARWEIQQRFRQHKVKGIGIDNRTDAVSIQYKRGYFIDWKVLDIYKDSLFNQIDYWLDTNDASNPKLIDSITFFKGINNTVNKPFRVVPFFDPAPWGGQWIKNTCGLDREKINYGWCFDCVPEENSLLFNINGILFELPSNDLVLLRSRELLGEAVEARFGKDFPIRFDFLDTMDGGNLSLQVHPTTQFIHENFGVHYTQDESYYLLDAKEDASVYLGLKNDMDSNLMIDDLRKAQRKVSVFDVEKYVNKFPAKKHDHFLIPGGTVHCSGANAMVLEISSTPNLFTFKLWDWQRLGLDGKPRPINIERGLNVIDWKRNTDYTKKYLCNQIVNITSGDGWREEKTGLHENEFIETRRHWFTKTVKHSTNRSVNVLNLIEGDEAVVKSPTNAFEPFVIHYAETFIIPACLGEYTITPLNAEKNKEYGTIKAYIRF